MAEGLKKKNEVERKTKVWRILFVSSNVTYDPKLPYDPVESVTFRHHSGDTECYLIKDK